MRRITIAELPCGVAAVILLTLAAVLVPTAAAGANTFAVSNTADSGPGSLRKAIEEADANPGRDSIAIAAGGTIELQSALPDLTGELDIAGPGASALNVHRGAGAPAFRIFNVDAGAPATPVSISGMTISNGKAEVGGGINVNSGSLTLTRVTVTGNEATVVGGGILVAFFKDGGPLTLRESLVNANAVRAISGMANGGGVSAERGALIDRSAIVENRVEVPSPPSNAVAIGGGAILGGGQSEIRQSTIADNAIVVGPAATGLTLRGGGAFVENTRILGSTIAANSTVSSSPGQGANLFGGLNQNSVADTILSAPRGGPSCGGSVRSEGFNIDDGSSCALTQPTDLSGVDPLLAPLLLTNGGSIPNLALLPGSPAIDHGNAFGAATDERGRPRPSDFATIANAAGGDGSDIGAFEAQALPPGPPSSARLYVTGQEKAFPEVAAIKTQSNEVIGEPTQLRNAASNHHAIAISPDGTRAYIANDGSENVSAIDTATNSELTGSPVELPDTARPLDIAVTPDGTRAYVAGEFGRISVIDTATNAEVAGSPIVLPTLEGKNPRPTAIAISPDGTRAYVADTASELIFVIDTRTNAVIGSPIDLEPGPGSGLFLTAIAVTPDGKRAYVTSNVGDEVFAIDTETNSVSGQPIKTGILEPSTIAISPDGTRAYVANQGTSDPRANTVAVIDTQTNQLLASIPVGNRPAALAVTPDGTRVYVANEGDHDISAVDTRTDRPLPETPIDLGADFRPVALAIAPDQGPIASFGVPATIRLGAPLHPDPSASRDPDGAVAAFNWDFGDGAKASGQSPQHSYIAPGTYNVTLALADDEGCLAGQIFTGHTVSCEGSAAFKTSRTVTVVLPAVRVSCPAKARRRGCHVKLRVVTRKRHGKAETKLARAKLRAGKSKLLSLHPRAAFIATLGVAKKATVRETVRIGRLRRTTVRRLAIR